MPFNDVENFIINKEVRNYNQSGNNHQYRYLEFGDGYTLDLEEKVERMNSNPSISYKIKICKH